jgi:hypothetical protein
VRTSGTVKALGDWTEDRDRRSGARNQDGTESITIMGILEQINGSVN